VGHRLCVPIRPAPGERRPKLGTRARLLLEQGAAGGDELARVHVAEPPPEGAPAPEGSLRDALEHTPQDEAVARRDQVDGRPHQRHADRVPPGDQALELLRAEALEP
jgi:hypothetical protein